MHSIVHLRSQHTRALPLPPLNQHHFHKVIIIIMPMDNNYRFVSPVICVCVFVCYFFSQCFICKCDNMNARTNEKVNELLFFLLISVQRIFSLNFFYICVYGSSKVAMQIYGILFVVCLDSHNHNI